VTDYTFKPASVLTFETVKTDSLRLNKLLSRKEVTELRINLSEVTHCDSTGLALLIEAKRLCNQRKIGFSLENISDSLLGLAKFCGVDTVLL
jgi:phospholipid transport system transporter-binding protein